MKKYRPVADTFFFVCKQQRIRFTNNIDWTSIAGTNRRLVETRIRKQRVRTLRKKKEAPEFLRERLLIY